MHNDDPIILYIVLRQSLHLNNDEESHCVANAIQHILLKYFMWQLLAVKANLDSSSNDEHIKNTTKWLSSRSKKSIISVDEEIWIKIKQEFNIGKDVFCIKNIECIEDPIEKILVFWPCQYSKAPDYIRELNPLL